MKTKTDVWVISIFTITMVITVITSFVAMDSVLHDVMKYVMLASSVVCIFRAMWIVTKSNISDVKRYQYFST